MLTSAINEGPSVSVDILTYSDLQALKRQKAGQVEMPSGAASTNKKRYVILTYAAQFDRCAASCAFLQDPLADHAACTCDAGCIFRFLSHLKIPTDRASETDMRLEPRLADLHLSSSSTSCCCKRRHA